MTTVQTTTVNFHGRDITVRLPTETQLGLLAQQARAAASNDPARVFRAIAIIMDVIHNLIDPADQDYVVDLMAAGDIEARETLAIISAFQDEEAPSARPAAVRRARK